MGRKNISRGKNKNVTDYSNLLGEMNSKKQSGDNPVKDTDKKEG